MVGDTGGGGGGGGGGRLLFVGLFTVSGEPLRYLGRGEEIGSGDLARLRCDTGGVWDGPVYGEKREEQ